ncbi:hypothetical protein PsYK624_123820 [Phanerochaete sordida]|uniref:F-box domain-containing protein n=1 Tax=Phanerochaete sordida TaxID=48140 RepID=A0A9P3LIZ9_9APHY|nr:hypothetical protein PsYK624_123820 [Phanerochaete sordida]
MLDESGQVLMSLEDPPSPLMDISFDVEPADLLREFEDKWRLKIYSVSAMKNLYEEVKASLQASPQPKLQTLCLLDLPPELLHLVMQLCGVDGARRLGATCHSLREVSVPYIYLERNLEIKFDPKWNEINGEDPKAVHDYIQALAASARDEFIGDVAFLLSRPDISERIETLIVSGWQYRYFDMAGWEPFDENVVEFLLPISVHIHDLIAASPNIKKLSLCFLVITQAMRECIITLKQLNELKVISSKVTGSANLPPSASALRNLTIRISDPLDLSAWTFMHALSDLRWLLLAGTKNGARILPPPEIVQSCNPFVTVQRAFIDGVQPMEQLDLAALFTSASLATDHRLPLVELKISMSYGIDDLVVDALLAALEGSALRYFVLDGTTYGEPQLIDEIAQKLPDLRSLTLIYRDSYRQTKGKAANWPRPTWEYARRLGRFRQLSHFGWNLDITPTTTPATMELMEDGYPDDWWEYIREDWLDPSTEVAKLLAAYCPSLEMVVFLDGLPYRFQKIVRSPQGDVSTEDSFSYWDYYARHNPLLRSWPVVERRDDA